MGTYLEKVTDWEEFGYHLLPENKEHLMEVSMFKVDKGMNIKQHSIQSLLTY